MMTLTLSSVVAEVNDARLFGHAIPQDRRHTLATFLASRRGLPGSYSGLFSPVADEVAHGYRFFTGERISTRAGTLHILGEEALRALALLKPRDRSLANALVAAASAMEPRLRQSETERGGGARGRGVYCCNRCSVALWRAFAANAYDQSLDRLRCGLKWLRERRSNGEWSGMPFYYTLSALIEAGDEASDELRFVRTVAGRRRDRLRDNGDPHAVRRRRVLDKALAV